MEHDTHDGSTMHVDTHPIDDKEETGYERGDESNESSDDVIEQVNRMLIRTAV